MEFFEILGQFMVPLLGISVVYLIWCRWMKWFNRRQTILRERVAYMLWCAAQEHQHDSVADLSIS
jgi:hypothetical protein